MAISETITTACKHEHTHILIITKCNHIKAHQLQKSSSTTTRYSRSRTNKQTTASTQPRCRRHLSTVHYRPSIADTASGRPGSQRRAAEDRRCDTPTDSCHSRAALRRPCTLDRTPCERRPPSPEARSPPNTSRHQLAYLFTVADSLLMDNTNMNITLHYDVALCWSHTTNYYYYY